MSDWSLKPRRHKEPEAQSRRQQQRFEARMDCIASTEVSCNLLCFFSRSLWGILMHEYTHTVAQNCHCEFCCGMHLTCKNNPVTPDQKGRGMENWKLTIPFDCKKGKPDCDNSAVKTGN